MATSVLSHRCRSEAPVGYGLLPSADNLLGNGGCFHRSRVPHDRFGRLYTAPQEDMGPWTGVSCG
jgi:hypothetical protein